MQRENGYRCDRSSSARPRETPTIESAPRCRQWAMHSRLDEVARKPRQRVESHGISPLPASWYRAIWSDGTRTHRGVRGNVQVQLEGQVAIVTGAGRGIGRAIALELARLGAGIVGGGGDQETAGGTARGGERVGPGGGGVRV